MNLDALGVAIEAARNLSVARTEYITALRESIVANRTNGSSLRDIREVIEEERMLFDLVIMNAMYDIGWDERGKREGS